VTRRRRPEPRAVVGIIGALLASAAPDIARAEQAIPVARVEQPPELAAAEPVAPARQAPLVDAPLAPPQNPVQSATSGGNFLPLTLPADVGRTHAFAFAYGGYDSAAQNARLVSFAEARLYGPLALRISAQSTGASEKIAPSVAARLQFLSAEKQGVDAAFSLAYNAEGFTEFEGEIEAVLAFGKSIGRWRLLANVAYGQDGEGAERDAEFRAAAFCHLGTLYYLGFDGRGRFGLGSDPAKLSAHDEPLYDADVGPVLHVALGPIALGAHVGFSLLDLVHDPRFGVLALAGLGSAL
jgi:hypothetical protein